MSTVHVHVYVHCSFQCDELGDISHDYSHDTEPLLTTTATGTEGTEGGEGSEGGDPVTQRERELMAELEELKAKKRRAERLMEGMHGPPQG